MTIASFLPILTFSFILLTNSALACIFQLENKSGGSPYWPSNNIEVCFAPPLPDTSTSVQNPMDVEFMNHYRNTVNVIKETVQGQINNRTGFNLTGFGVCPENERDRQSTNLPAKIRIDINGIQGAGAMASSIGPGSSGHSVNITLDSMDTQWPGGVKPPLDQMDSIQRVRSFNEASHMSWKSLHEILHLLGIHHSEYWDSGMDPDVVNVIQFGPSMDENSVMNRGVRNFDNRGRAVLSETDVACLNHIAGKTIEQFPSRAPTRPGGDTRSENPIRNTKPLPSGPVSR